MVTNYSESSDFKKTASRSAVDLVISSIKEKILNRELRAGDQLPNEFELCKQLNVSRGSLREAIKIMVATGILELRPGIGTFVTPGNKHSFQDSLFFNLFLTNPPLSEVDMLRQILEIDVMELIIFHYDQNADERENMRIEMNRLADMTCDGYTEEDLFQCDIQFHRHMAKACKNSVIESIYFSLIEYIQISMKEALCKQSPERVYQSHKALLNVINTRNAAMVADVVRFSLEPWYMLKDTAPTVNE